jgi:nucleoside phosphorylase/CheY-like chemotaxis protein
MLFVDDQPSMKRQLIELLVEDGVQRDNISVAQTALEARRLLQRNNYDLMVLDLALPEREEDDPERDGGVRLLRDITTRPQRYCVPRYIIGLTAFQELRDGLAGVFEENLWPLLHYDPSSSDWIDRIKNQVRHALASERSKGLSTYSHDVCLITALFKPELFHVLQLPWSWRDPLRLDDSTIFHEGTIGTDARNYSVVATSVQRMGPVATAVTTMKMIGQFRPRVLVMPGICAGVRGRNRYGDIVLANPVWDWQSGKVTETGELSLEPHQLHAPDVVVSGVAYLAERHNLLDEIRRAFPGTPPEHDLTIMAGPVATSTSVLGNAVTMKQVQAQNRKLAAVEMEAYGLYAGAQWCDPPRPQVAFALKSVADFGDEEKDDRYQEYAAYTSAAASDMLLRDLLPNLEVD